MAHIHPPSHFCGSNCPEWQRATADYSTWPEHLRPNAPHVQCGRCKRKSWNTDLLGQEDRMTQPDGYPCGGFFDIGPIASEGF